MAKTAFLAERVFIVSAFPGPRIKSNLYRFNLFFLFLGLPVLVCNVVRLVNAIPASGTEQLSVAQIGRIYEIHDNGICHVGLNIWNCVS